MRRIGAASRSRLGARRSSESKEITVGARAVRTEGDCADAEVARRISFIQTSLEPGWQFLEVQLYIGSISASPTACLLRGYGRAGTRNDRPSSMAVILSTGTPIPTQ